MHKKYKHRQNKYKKNYIDQSKHKIIKVNIDIHCEDYMGSNEHGFYQKVSLPFSKRREL